MRRYLIYAAVYGTIGACVGLAMAYASKDGKPYFSLVGSPRRKKDNMVELPQEHVNHSAAVEVPDEVPEGVEISE